MEERVVVGGGRRYETRGRDARRPLLTLAVVTWVVGVLGWWVLPSTIDGEYSEWWNVVQIATLLIVVASTALLAFLCAYSFWLLGQGVDDRTKPLAIGVGVVSVCSLIAVLMTFAFSAAGGLNAGESTKILTTSTSASRILQCAEFRDREWNEWFSEKRVAKLGGSSGEEVCTSLEEKGLLCDDGSLLTVTSGINYCLGDGASLVATAPEPVGAPGS